ncbi:MAG: ABC transporter ATP-binding protein [Acidimicrobiales bacterium]
MTDTQTPPTTEASNEPVADDVAIRATSVSKRFTLTTNGTSVKDRLTGFSRKTRTEFWAVRGVSVDVPRGSMLGVIGRNGSGKSTFLRTLCGIYRPTTGEISVQGRVTALLELGAGFHNELSGRENVYMNGAVVGLSREYMDSVMGEIVAMADIGEFIDAPVDTYSSGMRARLGFAVSVQLQPEILLADEITAVGDITFKDHGARRMRALRESGVTIVQVSHNLSMLQESCDSILWLHHGEMMGYGDPVDVIADYVAHAASQEETAKIDRTPEHEARNPTWFTRADIATGLGTTLPTLGDSLRFVIGLDLPEAVLSPSLRIRFTRPNDVPVGVGMATDDMGNSASGSLAVNCVIPKLQLPAGRYRVVIELCSADEVVANKRIPLEVTAPVLGEGVPFLPIDVEWDIR